MSLLAENVAQVEEKYLLSEKNSQSLLKAEDTPILQRKCIAE